MSDHGNRCIDKTTRAVHTTRRTGAIALLVLSFTGAGQAAERTAAAAHENDATAALSLIPLPADIQQRPGAFVWTPSIPIHADEDAAMPAAAYFKALLAKMPGIAASAAPAKAGIPDVVAGAAEAAKPGNPDTPSIHFTLAPQSTVAKPESYTLDVSPTGIRVTAADPRGLFYGGITLWQLLTSNASQPRQVAAVHIEDAPRFGWRGLMLDSARHFQSVDEIKRLLDAMALHKLNTFHWHLTDDQGWRIEIKRYPKLTSVGGCRVPAGDAGVGADGKPVDYCGFYSQAQIRDVVRYAAERHIVIVPEIDVPGHATAAIAAYPWLGVSGKPMPVSNEWGVNTHLFDPGERTVDFLENVLAEVVTLFPGPYVHIGGDEAVKDEWKASTRVQARMRALGLSDEMQLQGSLVAQLEKYLVAHQRRLIGWDEILDSPLPAEATVMSWRGTDGGVAAARSGRDVVMSPVSDLYFNYLQTDSPDEPPGRPITIDLRRVYAFEPVPAVLTAAQRRHVLGLQANLWTEHIRDFARVQHALFPRIAALAETGWSLPARRNYDSFLARLPAQLQRYRALGIAYAPTPFAARIDAAADRRPGRVTVTLSNAAGYRDFRYTTDGSAPTAASPRYVRPLTLAMPAVVKAAVFVDARPLGAVSDARFDAASLLTRRDEQLATCAGKLVLRLEDDGPRDGDRAVYDVDIFDPCWLWKGADLRGIHRVSVRAARIPYNFQLAHDEPQRSFRPAVTAHGELQIRDGCQGRVLARVAMPAQPDADGFVTLDAALAADAKAHDLCIYFTGDTRPAMWVLDRVTLVPRMKVR